MHNAIHDITEKGMNKGLQIQTTGSLPKLSNGQSGLYKAIQKAVYQNKPITMDDIVDLYCKFVRSNYVVARSKGVWVLEGNREVYKGSKFSHYDEYDVKKEYKNKTSTWHYTLRALIRQWFVNNIGTLVLKGMLIALPIINVED